MTTKEKESVSQLGRAAARDLRALLQGEVSLPGEPSHPTTSAMDCAQAVFVITIRKWLAQANGL